MKEKNLYNGGEIDFLKWQFEYVQDQIKTADNKINFLLVIYLALLSVEFAQIEKIVHIISNSCWWWEIIFGVISILFLSCIAIFFYYFINTIKPRKEPQEILGKEDYKSFIFWGHVAEINFENFKDTRIEKFYDDLKNQVFINSVIANIKFKNVSSAYKLLYPTLIIFLILLTFIHLIGG